MNKLLSIHDIFEISGKKCNVFTYPQLQKIRDIEELFGDNKSCIIMYVSKITNDTIQGHWTLLNKIPELIKSKKGVVKRQDSYHFLDSYAEFPDDQLKYIEKYFRKQSKQNEPILSKLLYESGKPVHYNDKKMQIMNENIATCGRYIALYLKYNELSVEEFVDTILDNCEKYQILPDLLVTLLTM